MLAFGRRVDVADSASKCETADVYWEERKKPFPSEELFMTTRVSAEARDERSRGNRDDDDDGGWGRRVCAAWVCVCLLHNARRIRIRIFNYLPLCSNIFPRSVGAKAQITVKASNPAWKWRFAVTNRYGFSIDSFI
jgi:hypothetical protein